MREQERRSLTWGSDVGAFELLSSTLGLGEKRVDRHL